MYFSCISGIYNFIGFERFQRSRPDLVRTDQGKPVLSAVYSYAHYQYGYAVPINLLCTYTMCQLSLWSLSWLDNNPSSRLVGIVSFHKISLKVSSRVSVGKNIMKNGGEFTKKLKGFTGKYIDILGRQIRWKKLSKGGSKNLYI